MKLHIARDDLGKKDTTGILKVNGEFECFTLEDRDRKLEDGGTKVFGETAIPRGKYKVILTMSARFKRVLPLVVDVPGFEGVRFHPGVTHIHTHGCILTGTGRGVGEGFDRLIGSKVAFEALFAKMEAAVKRAESIELEIA